MNKRKKWTPQAEITESLLKLREKRKWQIALRRYILERNPCQSYAPYFGLSITDFRKWIELQFSNELYWENFGVAWQFDHVVPVAYFDFANENDLRLCWNFINIRVEQLDLNKNRGHRIDVLAVKPYFEALYRKTGIERCKKMIEKIITLEICSIISEPYLEGFLTRMRSEIEELSSLTNEEFNSINKGVSLNDILLEKEILKKFG